MTPEIEKVVADYKAAYREAHGSEIEVGYKAGLFRLGPFFMSPYRRAKIVEMTERLRKRAKP